MIRENLCAAHRWSCLVAALVTLTGCNLTGDVPLPVGTTDPRSLQNAEGALAVYRGAVSITPVAFLNAVLSGGLITDELQAYDFGGPSLAYLNTEIGNVGDFAMDARQLPEHTIEGRDKAFTAAIYATLQNVRAQAAQGIGFLKAYAPTNPALQGHLYALKGYAEIFLADLFCSGVPLSTLDYDEDFTYLPGSSTAEIYAHAVALFDTAIALSADSLDIQRLARVGKARALVAIGQFNVADTVVQPVPDDFRVGYDVNWGSGGLTNSGEPAPVFRGYGITVSDQEGINGLPYRSSGDPRTVSPFIVLVPDELDPVYETNRFGDTMSFPQKYGNSLSSITSVTLADGLEARLIQAEAKLRAGNGEAAMIALNALRAPYIDSEELQPIPSGLTPIQMQDTLFYERAAWLFLTGHREGDLRRRVRQYNRTAADVFPIGAYGAFYTTYSADVTLPIPFEERRNPYFHGCAGRGA